MVTAGGLITLNDHGPALRMSGDTPVEISVIFCAFATGAAASASRLDSGPITAAALSTEANRLTRVIIWLLSLASSSVSSLIRRPLRKSASLISATAIFTPLATGTPAKA